MFKWIGIIVVILVVFLPQNSDELSHTYRGLPSSWTMIPSRSLAGLHYIFKGYKLNEAETLVRVSGPVVEITNGETLGAKVFKDGFMSEIDLEDFEDQQELGLSVFEATTSSGANVATAFLVGKNIVFTNRHVISRGKKDGRLECGKFSIKLNHKEEVVGCKSVRYCGRRYDYCAVEMNPMANGLPLSSEIKPLRLGKRPKSSKDIRLLHIGNAAGLGLQASYGSGIKIQDGEFYHFVPTLVGSSGAPILNDRGYVLGINWGHTGGNYLDDSSFNRGVLSENIFEELKTHRPELIREIKSFRSWLQRSRGHRHVKISESSEGETSSSKK